MRPLVAVRILTYNHERYIAQALASVLEQVTNFEYKIVIGEDCSTDNTKNICVEYAKKYPDKIILLCNAKNDIKKNSRDNFEECKKTGAKYIALLEGDDYWTDPFKLQKQVDLLEANSSLSICFHRAIERHEGSPGERIIPDGPMNAILGFADLLEGSNFIPTLSCVFKNFDVPLPSWFYQLYFADYGLHLINAKRGDIGFIDEVMGVYRINQSSIHGKLTSTNEGLAKAYVQHVQFWEVIKQTNEFNNKLVSAAQEKAIKNVEYYRMKVRQSKSPYLFKLWAELRKILSMCKRSLSSLFK